MTVATNGKRGRPAGVKNGEGTTALAPIRKWTPLHENIVQMHIAHVDNEIIAKRLDITPTRVSQVINDPRAKAIIAEHINLIREKSKENIEEQLLNLSVLSIQRLHETLAMPFVPGTDAKKHQDNVSMGIVKGLMPTSEANRGGDRGDISEKLFDRLVGALEKSNEAREYHGKIVDAEVEIVVEAE